MVYELLGLFIATQSKILRLPDCAKFDADLSIVHRHRILEGALVATQQPLSWPDCAKQCLKFKTCESINFNREEGICQMNMKDTGGSSSLLTRKRDWTYVETPQVQEQVCHLFKRGFRTYSIKFLFLL